MLSRLDIVVFAGWLLSGSMAVENHHRVDLTPEAPNPVPAQSVVCRTAARPFQRSTPRPISLTDSIALSEGASGLADLFADDCGAR